MSAAIPLITYDALEPAHALQQRLTEAGIDSHLETKSHDTERIVPTGEPGGWRVELDDVTSFTLFVAPDALEQAREVLAQQD